MAAIQKAGLDYTTFRDPSSHADLALLCPSVTEIRKRKPVNPRMVPLHLRRSTPSHLYPVDATRNMKILLNHDQNIAIFGLGIDKVVIDIALCRKSLDKLTSAPIPSATQVRQSSESSSDRQSGEGNGSQGRNSEDSQSETEQPPSQRQNRFLARQRRQQELQDAEKEQRARECSPRALAVDDGVMTEALAYREQKTGMPDHIPLVYQERAARNAGMRDSAKLAVRSVVDRVSLDRSATLTHKEWSERLQ